MPHCSSRASVTGAPSDREFRGTMPPPSCIEANTVAPYERPEREQCHRSVEDRAGKLRTIAERCAKLVGPGLPSVEHGDVLHDDQGLPK